MRVLARPASLGTALGSGVSPQTRIQISLPAAPGGGPGALAGGPGASGRARCL
jgi:hypothetical protein